MLSGSIASTREYRSSTAGMSDIPIDRACTSSELTLLSSMVPVITCPSRRSPLLLATSTPLTTASTNTDTAQTMLRGRRAPVLVAGVASSSAISRAARAV